MHLTATLGQHKRLFWAWLVFGAVLYAGRLPRPDTELVILRVAHLRGCEYELQQHRRFAERRGVPADVQEKIFDWPDAEGLSSRRQALLKATDEFVEKRTIGGDAWDALSRHLNPRQLIEFCMLAGQYDALAATINALAIPLDFPEQAVMTDQSRHRDRSLVGDRGRHRAAPAGSRIHRVCRSAADRSDGSARRDRHPHRYESTSPTMSALTAFVSHVIEETGRIDVLVNNAGYGCLGAIEDVPMTEARREFDVNLFGLARLIQLVVPHMRGQRSGRIINVSSIGGKLHMPLGGWYHARNSRSKASVMRFAWNSLHSVSTSSSSSPARPIPSGIVVAADHLLRRSGDSAYADQATVVVRALSGRRPGIATRGDRRCDRPRGSGPPAPDALRGRHRRQADHSRSPCAARPRVRRVDKTRLPHRQRHRRNAASRARLGGTIVMTEFRSGAVDLSARHPGSSFSRTPAGRRASMFRSPKPFPPA